MNGLNEEKEILVLLPDKVEDLEKYILWRMEDRVANRWTPVFCSPSLAAAQRGFEEAVKKPSVKAGDVRGWIVGAMEKGKLLVMDEKLGES